MVPAPVYMSRRLVLADAAMFCFTLPPKKGCILLCLNWDAGIFCPLRLLCTESPFTQLADSSTPLLTMATWGIDDSMGSGRGPRPPRLPLDGPPLDGPPIGGMDVA